MFPNSYDEIISKLSNINIFKGKGETTVLGPPRGVFGVFRQLSAIPVVPYPVVSSCTHTPSSPPPH